MWPKELAQFLGVIPLILECHVGPNLDPDFLEDVVRVNHDFICEIAGPKVRDPIAAVRQGLRLIQHHHPQYLNKFVTQTPELYDWEMALARDLYNNPKCIAQRFAPVVSNKNIPLLDNETRLPIIAAVVSFDGYAPIILPFENSREMLATYLKRNEIAPMIELEIEYYYDLNLLYDSELYADDIGRLRRPEGYEKLDILPPCVDMEYVFETDELEVLTNV